MMTISKRSSIPIQFAFALLLGIVAGRILKDKAQILGDITIIIIQILKMLAGPLIFCAIVDTFCKIEAELKGICKLLVIACTNAVIAGVIAISVSEGFFFLFPNSIVPIQVANTVQESSSKAQMPHITDMTAWIPKNLFEPFLNNSVVSIVILALILGLTLKKLKTSPSFHEESKVFEKIFSGGYQIISFILKVVIKLVPFAIFGSVAKLSGTQDINIIPSLAVFITIVVIGMFLYGFGYYSLILKLVVKASPIRFFQEVSSVLMTAFGTGSSLATLPVTLRTLEEKRKVSHVSTRLAACVGTNLNHDGIILYEAAAALFIAKMHGIALTLSQKALLIVISTMAAVGIAGIPDAGLITLSLVLNAIGLPLSWISVLVSVDWLIGRMRATVNVTSDMVVATLLDHFKDGFNLCGSTATEFEIGNRT